jgi:putative ABC transport system permease protein
VTAKLVVENLKHKPMRSLLSMFLIAVPVTLILCLVGLSRGMLADSARRARGIGADIIVRPPKTSALTLSGAPIPEKLIDAIQSKPHVALAIGMIVHPVSSVSFVSGIDLDAFNRMSGGFKYLQGGPFQGPDDIIVDEYYASQHKLHAGDHVTDVLNHRPPGWRVSGVVEGGKLARLAVPIRTLQDLTGNTGKVSQIFVKADKPADIPLVLKELKTFLEDYNIYTMEEFTSLLTVENVQGGALSTFIDVMVGIGVVIGFAVVLLSMYMAVLQRTREIGILKALGASRWFILKVILAEAVVMGVGGTVVGIGLSFAARALISALYPASLTQAITPDWWPIAGAISLVGVVLGALYPGLSAAAQDPIEALAYE